MNTGDEPSAHWRNIDVADADCDNGFASPLPPRDERFFIDAGVDNCGADHLSERFERNEPARRTMREASASADSSSLISSTQETDSLFSTTPLTTGVDGGDDVMAASIASVSPSADEVVALCPNDLFDSSDVLDVLLMSDAELFSWPYSEAFAAFR